MKSTNKLVVPGSKQALDYLKIIEPEAYKKRFNELKNELVNSDQTSN